MLLWNQGECGWGYGTGSKELTLHVTKPSLIPGIAYGPPEVIPEVGVSPEHHWAWLLEKWKTDNIERNKEKLANILVFIVSDFWYKLGSRQPQRWVWVLIFLIYVSKHQVTAMHIAIDFPSTGEL